LHPEDNNERQPIHEHYSISLAAAPRKKPVATKAAASKAVKTNVAAKDFTPQSASPGRER
jgi:hypothetical protein